ncbi:MAG: flagellar biosynthesis repressor FlbT [Anderseniella sp.]
MNSSFKLAVQANQKVFINGAVIRVDRKVGIEFLNNVTFLLGSHVLQPEDVTTPLRQLYFVVQSMLIDPANRPNIMQLYRNMSSAMLGAYQDPQIQHGLKIADAEVMSERDYDALRSLKGLFHLEAETYAAAFSSADLIAADQAKEVAVGAQASGKG